VLSKTAELESLVREKADLEEESRRLDVEQKKLNLRAKTLYEKLIQEMRRKNTEKQQTLSQLQSKIGNLEKQLANISGSGGLADSEETPAEKSDDSQNDQMPEAYEEGPAGADDNVTVAEIEEEIELNSGQDRKKRKFF